MKGNNQRRKHEKEEKRKGEEYSYYAKYRNN